MTNADKRSVATDALETLGLPIEASEQGRDAIHLAVEPVTATTTVYPGMPVDKDGKPATPGVGIVDPFRTGPIHEGQGFWLVVYPRQITSLRHVWEHPAFDTEGPTDSEAWIANFAAEINQTVSRLMDAADEWVDGSEYTYDNSEAYKDHWEKFPEFWDHWENVTGRKGPEQNERHSFFTCSC